VGDDDWTGEWHEKCNGAPKNGFSDSCDGGDRYRGMDVVAVEFERFPKYQS
jgi:hypothetical protein